jgi:hypothetical protein|tara:strand:- start:643 stop:828 length:186 start_codon:yes stop_codon:yes gene_type:complete
MRFLVVINDPVCDILAENWPELESLGRPSTNQPNVVQVGMSIDKEIPIDTGLVMACTCFVD